jgi:hypothetical protein
VLGSANDVFMHASARVGVSSDDQCMKITAGDANVCAADFSAGDIHAFRGSLVHQQANSEKTSLSGVMIDGFCSDGVTSGAVTKLSTAMIVSAGAAAPSSDIHFPQTVAESIAAKTLLQSADTNPGTGDSIAATIYEPCVNDYYWQFGMYDTVTPRFHIDAVHEGVDPAQPIQKKHFVSVMGMKHYIHIPLPKEASMDKQKGWGGQTADRRESFSDLITNAFGAGYANVPDAPVAGTDGSAANHKLSNFATGGNAQKLTASVIVGENGIDQLIDKTVASGRNYGVATIVEHPEKYAYIGRGYDQLTVTPVPDLMSGKKAIITFEGPKSGCTVTEVDRGTHESAECSGRGNCDRETGTCICDAGYTLEACSEQTVLV